jgi:hypothetical protein
MNQATYLDLSTVLSENRYLPHAKKTRYFLKIHLSSEKSPKTKFQKTTGAIN